MAAAGTVGAPSESSWPPTHSAAPAPPWLGPCSERRQQAYSDSGPAATCSALRRCPGRCCGRGQHDQAADRRLLTLCCRLATKSLTNALLFNCNGGAQRAGQLCSCPLVSSSKRELSERQSQLNQNENRPAAQYTRISRAPQIDGFLGSGCVFCDIGVNHHIFRPRSPHPCHPCGRHRHMAARRAAAALAAPHCRAY